MANVKADLIKGLSKLSGRQVDVVLANKAKALEIVKTWVKVGKLTLDGETRKLLALLEA